MLGGDHARSRHPAGLATWGRQLPCTSLSISLPMGVDSPQLGAAAHAHLDRGPYSVQQQDRPPYARGLIGLLRVHVLC